MFNDEPEPQAVALRNAAVCSASGSLSCASVWLIVHSCIMEKIPQVCYLPYIVSVLGYITILLSPHSLGSYVSLEDSSDKARRGVLFLGTILVAVGPVGSAWAGYSLRWTAVSCEIIMSCLFLAGAAFLHKFCRIY